MKKHFIKFLMAFAICVLSLPLILSGCGVAPLATAPTESSTTKVYGSALVYNNYIYFANAFASSSSLTQGENDFGSVDNSAIYRIATTDGKITTNEETTMPENLEKAVSKIAGSEYSFMYSSGNYIYFASPSTHFNDSRSTVFTYNAYIRINTDGTGYTEFYASTSTITQQTVLTINNEEYLILVDGTKLVKIKLGSTISNAVVLAEDFTSVVFADKFMATGDEFAYYLTDISEEDTNLGKSGDYLNKVDIVTGDKTEKINSNQIREITLKQVYNGKLYFIITELVGTTALNPKFASLGTSFTYTAITTPIADTSIITGFTVVLGEDNNEYYVFTNSDSAKTYVLTSGETDFASNVLVEKEINILFSFNDYLYYSVADTGIYRISVRDKVEQQISDKTTFKTEGISFDGKYIYYFATNTDNTTGTYYMHRSKVDIGSANSQLLSLVLEDDEPADEEEE